MPNWTTDEGVSLFGKKQCKYCLQWIETDEQGKILIHTCIQYHYQDSSTDDDPISRS